MAPIFIIPLLVAFVGIVSHKLIRKHQKPIKIKFHGGKRYPAKPRSALLTKDELEAYHRDGFVLKKNVINDEEVRDLVASSAQISEGTGAHFFAKLLTQVWKNDESFARVAFESSFPSISAQLLDEKAEDGGSVRILKDGFFGFASSNNKGCGFHVDDKFFWPASNDSTGVNFWLALSPMSVSEGGGISVVNQTVTEPFAKECIDAIHTATCDMEELSPECHERMLDAATTFDFEPGDVLIWDRWTFHRSNPFHVNTGDSKLRYTIRYVPGSATAEGVLHESQTPGEKFQGAYYPQVWPGAVKLEVDEIQAGLENGRMKH